MHNINCNNNQPISNIKKCYNECGRKFFGINAMKNLLCLKNNNHYSSDGFSKISSGISIFFFKLTIFKFRFRLVLPMIDV